jgi:uncharacterized protein DUF6424
MTSTGPELVHGEYEDHKWDINVPDHPTRADSPEYVAARKQMIELAANTTGLIYGSAPFQDHHGSALWLKDVQGWFLVRNLAGREYPARPRPGLPALPAGLHESAVVTVPGRRA